MFVFALRIEAASFCGVPTLRDGTKDKANSLTRSFYGGERPKNKENEKFTVV